MMKRFALFALMAGLAFGQASVIAPTSTVNTAALPSYTIGSGPSWVRGGTYPYSLDVTLALHVGNSQWYSWSTISTPIATAAPGTGPIPSTITTGGAWIPVQSPNGSVSLVVIVQAGFSTVQANSTVAPAFTGSLGFPIKLGKSNWYVMPFAKASNASTSTNSGALASAIFQPGLQFMYGFSKTAAPTVAPIAVPAKAIRKIFQRAHIPVPASISR